MQLLEMAEYSFKCGYAMFLQMIEKIYGIDAAKKLDVKIRFHKKINLDTPQTLDEKVSYLSLHALTKQAVACTDKWEARQYVVSKGLGDILVPICAGPYSDAMELDFDALPDCFVLKATHGCGMNYVCLDKKKIKKTKCLSTVRKWLKQTYGTFSVEPHYRKLSHRVYCEKLIGDGKPLIDYKIHCLNGKPSFILVCSNRIGSAVTMDIFDLEWNWIDAVKPYKRHTPGNGQIPKPKNLEKMLQIAEVLSEDFVFVRVDLYNLDGKIYFGELTFTPANGVFPSYKKELLIREGKKLDIKGENTI